MSDKLFQMQVFAAVAEAASFAKGARHLKLSAPAVTRAVIDLEHRLGVKLLNRTTRQVSVTEAGRTLLEHVHAILGLVATAEDAAQGIHCEPRGALSVSAPVLFGKLYVTPLLVAFLEKYPQVQVRAQFLDRVVNLMEEGIDVAIRIGALSDSNLRAIRVGSIGRVVCAAPEYLERHGHLETPDDLAEHCIIAATNVSPSLDWRFAEASAQRLVRVTPRLSVSHSDAAIEATLRGFGVTQLLSYQVAAHIATGRLVRLLPSFECEPVPVHVLYRDGRHASAKIQAFVQMIVAQLRGDPALSISHPLKSPANVSD